MEHTVRARIGTGIIKYISEMHNVKDLSDHHWTWWIDMYNLDKIIEAKWNQIDFSLVGDEHMKRQTIDICIKRMMYKYNADDILDVLLKG